MGAAELGQPACPYGTHVKKPLLVCFQYLRTNRKPGAKPSSLLLVRGEGGGLDPPAHFLGPGRAVRPIGGWEDEAGPTHPPIGLPTRGQGFIPRGPTLTLKTHIHPYPAGCG